MSLHCCGTTVLILQYIWVNKIDILIMKNLIAFFEEVTKISLQFWESGNVCLPHTSHMLRSHTSWTWQLYEYIRCSTTLLHYLPWFQFCKIMKPWWMLSSDFPLVGNICGFHTCTWRCWVACNPWANLPHIVASFHQWDTIAWGLLLLALDLITISTAFWICLW